MAMALSRNSYVNRNRPVASYMELRAEVAAKVHSCRLALWVSYYTGSERRCSHHHEIATCHLPAVCCEVPPAPQFRERNAEGIQARVPELTSGSLKKTKFKSILPPNLLL